jgi:hypothetical protein
VLDAPGGRALTGVPFAFEATADTAVTLGFRLLARDDVSGATLLDGVDLAALDGDGDGAVRIDATLTGTAAEAHFRLRRAFLSHAFFAVVPGAP